MTSSSFKQCAAFRPDGQRCQRAAREGNYCHSHRHYQPKTRMPPTVAERVEHHLFSCVDCNRLIPPDRALTFTIHAKPDPAESSLVLCEPCYRLRQQIETRIMEIVSAAPGHSLHTTRIYEDLECFGVDQDLVEAARLRMHADGRLVSST